VHAARGQCDRVVASLFVNPKQFGPSEDLAAYPRDEGRDFALLADAGCDLVHAPADDDVYPPGFSTTVTVAGVSAALEGAIRPGHFARLPDLRKQQLTERAPRRDPFARPAEKEGGREPRAQVRKPVVQLPGNDGRLEAGEHARPGASRDQLARWSKSVWSKRQNMCGQHLNLGPGAPLACGFGVS